ncbi:MAG: flagellar protein FlgN [Leptospirillia bacterium]
MSDALATLRAGVDLYADLADLLSGGRDFLAQNDLLAIEEANRRHQELLERIASWERDAADLAGTADGGDGPARLSDVIPRMPSHERAAARALLDQLKTALDRARHQAAVNHIVVDRSLCTVRHTLEFYTGGKAADTYDARGGVARGAGHGLIERKG